MKKDIFSLFFHTSVDNTVHKNNAEFNIPYVQEIVRIPKNKVTLNNTAPTCNVFKCTQILNFY